MKREVSKFLSGLFAGLAWMHAAFAVATSKGLVEEPVFIGRRWGVGYMWTEAVLYSAISVALGYVGWIARPQPQLRTATISTADGQKPQNVTQTAQPISG